MMSPDNIRAKVIDDAYSAGYRDGRGLSELAGEKPVIWSSRPTAAIFAYQAGLHDGKRAREEADDDAR